MSDYLLWLEPKPIESCYHILKEHKKCKLCAKIFWTSKPLRRKKIGALNNNPKLKDSLEKELTLINYNNNKNKWNGFLMIQA